jgi:hypothetical protein
VSVISYQSDYADQSSSPVSNSKRATSQASSKSLSETRDATRNNAAQTQIDQSTVLPLTHTSGLGKDSFINNSTLDVEIDLAIVSSDLWSTAYREAVDSLGKDIHLTILKGENLAELFKQLEKIDKEVTQESVFLRGVRYLHSLQVPLDSFKLALDLVTPLTSIEPTAGMVFGIVKGVTAVSLLYQNFIILRQWLHRKH